MTTLQKIWVGVAVAVFAALAIFGASYKKDVGKEQTIKIGANYGMSGDVAQYGTWATNGIRLAVDEINASGGVEGKTIEVIFEDSKGKPADAVSAYQKLRAADAIQYVMTHQSSIALAVAPLANADRVIQMDISATTPAYSSPNDYTFRTSILAPKLAQSAGEFLAQDLGVQKVALISIQNDFGKAMAAAFRDAYKGEIVTDESFLETDTDFRPQLTKIKAGNADAVFLVGHVRPAGLVVKQAKELGISVPIFSEVHSVESKDFLDRAGSAAEGIVYVAPAFNHDSSSLVAKTFIKKYNERYKEDPTYFAAQAYDGVRALFEAWKSCKTEDTECVKKALIDVAFDGASGNIQFNENGDVNKAVSLKVIQEGKFLDYTT